MLKYGMRHFFFEILFPEAEIEEMLAWPKLYVGEKFG